jgi:hypothetical protein
VALNPEGRHQAFGDKLVPLIEIPEQAGRDDRTPGVGARLFLKPDQHLHGMDLVAVENGAVVGPAIA